MTRMPCFLEYVEFLEIDKNFEFKDVTATRNSGEFFNASASISHITQSNFGQFVAHEILPSKIKALLRNFITHLNRGKNKTSNLGRWQLTAEERNLVLNRLVEDLKRLESDFGVNIQKHWHIQTNILDKT